MRILARIQVIKRWALLSTQFVTAALVSLVMFTNIPLFLDKLRSTTSSDAYAPYFDILLIGLTGILFLMTWRKSIRYLAEPHFIWFGLIFIVYLYNYLRLVYIPLELPLEVVDENLNRLQRSILFPVYGMIIFIVGKRFIENFLIVAIALLIPFNFIDFLNPSLFAISDFEGSFYRADSTYLNANIAGESMILILLLLYRRLKSVPLIFLFLFTGFSIITTFSRAAIGAWVLMLLIVLITRKTTPVFKLLPVVIIVFYSTLVAVADRFLYFLLPDPDQVGYLVSRLKFWANIASDDESLEVDTESRGELARLTLESLLENPIAGKIYGPEFEFGLASHNQLLEYWYIFGIAGVLLWLATFYFLRRQGNTRLFNVMSPEALIFLWFTLFNHQLYSNAFWLIFYAMTMVSSDSRMKISSPLQYNYGYRSSNKSHLKRRKRRRSRRASFG